MLLFNTRWNVGSLVSTALVGLAALALGGCSNGPYGGSLCVTNNMSGTVVKEFIVPGQGRYNPDGGWAGLKVGETVEIGLDPVHYNNSGYFSSTVEVVAKVYDLRDVYIGIVRHSVYIPMYNNINVNNFNDSAEPQVWVLSPGDIESPNDPNGVRRSGFNLFGR